MGKKIEANSKNSEIVMVNRLKCVETKTEILTG